MDFKDPCNFVRVEPELNPGAIEEWISIVKDGKLKKGNQRRSDFSTKVKKHLSALGWVFSYAFRGNKRELRYKSPKGKWYYSLATACMNCVQEQPQIMAGEKVACSSSNLSLGFSDSVEIDPELELSNQKRGEDCGSTPSKENHSSDMITEVPGFDELSQKQPQIVHEEKVACSPSNLSLGLSDSLEIVLSFDLSNQHRAEDCDITGSTPAEDNRSSDLVTMVPSFDELSQKEKENRVEDCVMIAPKFDELGKKRKRVKDCDYTNEETPKTEEKENNHSSDLTRNVFSDDLSNQEQKKKRRKIVDTAASEKKKNHSIRIILNDDVSNQLQKKKRRKKEEKSEIRPRIGKSLSKMLRVMDDKKKKKGEKESLRFCRKDCSLEMNSDVCCVCHYGGELLLCDGCPSAFHYTCLGLSSLPEEELWFCPCCCCDICKSMESRNSTLMSCEQCQRRFHLKCLEDKGSSCSVSYRGWFCSSQCDRVFTALQNLINCKITIGGGDESDLVWTLMRAPNEFEHYDDEKMSKLDSAVTILHQGFEPSKDPLSGKDLVEEMIYRRDRGFYTVIVERNNEPVTVAAIRVGKNEAEIPLVATLWSHRRSGLCRLLMDELEKQLFRMGVCRLVLPAANEVLNTWTQRFGFSVMESSERLEVVKHGMLDFIGTVMCHKFLNMETQQQQQQQLDEEEEDSADSSLTE